MLTLKLKPGESIAVGDAVIKLAFGEKTVRLRFDAPADIQITRSDAKAKQPRREGRGA